jgi:protein-S-isoprenylcysteine O-methyltransferase Ste14
LQPLPINELQASPVTNLQVNQKTRIRIIQFSVLALLFAVMTMNPGFNGDGSDTVETIGVGLVLFCVVGRMWSILYIGTRKNLALVTTGPYSITRNPLYLFSAIGATGVGLFVGSLLFAIFLGLAAWAVLGVTAAREAKYLESLFDDEYRNYARGTPMFWPRPSLYREPADGVEFSPAALRQTFLDGLVFIAILPAVEVIEHLRDAGYMPILFDLF